MPERPGSLSGRAVVRDPGRPTVSPLEGVHVEVLGTGLADDTDENGFFTIEGITSKAEQALFRYDPNDDDHPELQKLLDLRGLKLGQGKDVSIGDVLLNENARVQGKVELADMPGVGKAGTLVFVPVGPYQTSTSGDGTFTFTELPEGHLNLAFFRPGYVAAARDVTLSGGQVLTLDTVTLEVDKSGAPPATVLGRVRTFDDLSGEGATVTLDGIVGDTDGGTRVVTDVTTALVDGEFSFSNVATGIYSFLATRPGSVEARFTRLLVTGPITRLPDLRLGPIPSVPDGGMGGGAGGGGGTGGASGGGTGGSTGGGTGGATGGGTGGSTGGGTGGSTGGGTGGATGGGASGGTGGGTGGGTVVVTIPTAPVGLNVVPGNGQLTVSWAPSAGATSYTVYWSTQPGVTKATGTAVTDAMSPFLHQGLMNGTGYYYVITASNSAGESPESAIASGVPAVPSTTQPTVVVTRPSNQQRGVFPSSAVTIRFSKAIDMASVTASTVTLTGPSGMVAATRVTSGNRVTLTPTAALATEATYTLNITTGVRDSAGNALAAAVTTTFTTSSPAPTGFTRILGDGDVTLTWNAVPGATSYVLERAASAGGPPTVSYTATGLIYNDQSVTNGPNYFFRVIAYTPFGLSPPSTELTVQTVANLPATPVINRVRPGKTTALVEWSNIAEADTYTLYRSTSSAGVYTQVVDGWDKTSYLDTGLTPNTNVFYMVQSQMIAGRSAYSKEKGAHLDPNVASAPANLTATPGYQWARLDWSAVPGATGYIIWRIDSPSGVSTQTAWVTQGTSFDTGSLSNGTQYRWFVAAVVNGAIGDLAEVAAVPNPNARPRPIVLGYPVVTADHVRMSWSATAGAHHGTLRRSTTQGGPYTTVIGNVNDDSTVTAGTRYYYVVTADYGATGMTQGLPSNEVTAVPLSSATPTTPTGITVQVTTAALLVSWAPVSNASGYDVAYSDTAGVHTSHCTTADPFATRCTLSGLTNETPYYLVVSATNGVTDSPDSAELTATPTALGTNAGLGTASVTTVGGNGAITLYWQPVNQATQYRVYRRGRLSDWQLLTTTASTTWNDATVTNETDYQYAMQAANASGARVSIWNVTGWETPTVRLPVRPSSFTVAPVRAGFMVSWAPIPGATGYSVRGGYYPGSGWSAAQTFCSTGDAFLTRCLVSATPGTQYHLTVNATSPEGTSAATDEIMASPSPTALAVPSATTYGGNASMSINADPLPGATQYRFYRRDRYHDWQTVSTQATPRLVEPVVNGVYTEYAMQALVGSEGTGWSMPGLDFAEYDAPPAVTGVTVTPGDGDVMVSWNPLPGASQYVVYSQTGPGLPETYRGQTSDAFATRFVFTSMNGTAVTARVAPYNVGIKSDYGTEVTTTPLAALPPNPSLTTIPGNEAMALSWASVSGATLYRVYRGSTKSDWRLMVSQSNNEWVDYDVENGERYRYAVQPVNATGPGVWTLGALFDVDATLPRAPVDVKATPGNGAVQLEWAVVPGVTQYQVFTSSSQLGPFAYAGATMNPFENRLRVMVGNGTTLWFQIIPFNSMGRGVNSVEVSATPSAALPLAPNVSLSGAGAGTIQVSWTTGMPAGTNFYVYRRTANALPTQVGMTANLSFTDPGLVSGTTYFYYVEPENGAGRGAWSLVTSAMAP